MKLKPQQHFKLWLKGCLDLLNLKTYSSCTDRNGRTTLQKDVTPHTGKTFLKGGLTGPSQLLFGFHGCLFNGFTGVRACKKRTSSSWNSSRIFLLAYPQTSSNTLLWITRAALSAWSDAPPAAQKLHCAASGSRDASCCHLAMSPAGTIKPHNVLFSESPY